MKPGTRIYLAESGILGSAVPFSRTVSRQRSSMAKRKRLYGFFAALTAAASFLSSPYAAVSAENSPSPSELVEQLGAPDFATREAATKKLMEMGYDARPALKSALEAKDPEIKTRAKKIWKEVKYMIFPKAGRDVANLLKAVCETAPSPFLSNWGDIAKKYPSDYVRILAFLRKEKGPGSPYMNLACAAFLSQLPTKEIAKMMLDDSDTDRRLTKIFSERSLDDFPSETPYLKMIRVLILAGHHPEALDAASKAWSEFHDKRYLGIVERIANGDAFSKALDMLQRKSFEHPNSKYTQWELCFFVELAKKAGEKEIIKSFLDNADIAPDSPAVANQIANILLSMGLDKEAIDILSGFTGPIAIYLRSVAIRRSGNAEDSERTAKTLISKINDSQACYALAQTMDIFDDPAVELALKRILNLDQAPYYVYAATLDLGRFYERKGKYALAAKYYEQGLANYKENLLSKRSNKPDSDDEIRKELRHDIKRLRRVAGKNPKLWFEIQEAKNNKNYAKALELLDKYIEFDPSFPDAWIEKTEALWRLERFDEALKAGRKAVDLAKQDQFAAYDALSWLGIVLQEKYAFGKALECFERTIELRPDSFPPYSMAATAAFYAGQYGKAVKLLDKALDVGGYDDYYPWIWRRIARSKRELPPDKKFLDHVKSLEFDNEWPAPVLRFYAGAISKQRCLEMAVDKDPKRDNEKKCEAYYYIGEMELAKGNRKEAKKLFEKCLECDIKDFRETIASQIRIEELKKENRKNGGNGAATAGGE